MDQWTAKLRKLHPNVSKVKGEGAERVNHGLGIPTLLELDAFG